MENKKMISTEQNKTNEVEVIDVKFESHEIAKRSRRNGSHLLVIFGGVFALLCFIFGSIVGRNSIKKEAEMKQTSAQTESSVKQGKNYVDVEGIISRKQSEYLARNQRIYESFLQEVKHAGESDFRQANRKIGSVVDDLTGFKVTTKLCYKMAKDNIMKTNDTAEAIDSAIQDPIIQPCMQGTKKINAAYDRLCCRLAESRSKFYADMAQFISDLPEEQINPDQQELLNHLNDINSQAQSLAFEKALVALGAAVDVILIRATLNSLTVVCRGVVAKLAGSATAGAISAAADGPLPIGDVVGVIIFAGGAAWSAYDIYQVTKVLPGELRSTLQNTIDDTRNDAIRNAEDAAGKLMLAYQQDAENINE